MVAGLLLAVADIGTVFAFNAVTFVWSAVMVFGVRPTTVVVETTDGIETLTDVETPVDPAAIEADRGGSWVTEATDGYRTIWRSRDLRLIVALYVAQTIVAGASAVYEVTIALELLEMSESGVGVLDAALGVGGLVGGVVALVLAQRGKLSRDFGIGVALWAAPLLLVAVFVSIPSALIAMVLIGIGNSLVDVNAETIIQRLVPDEVLGRVFGALDGAAIAGMALGAAMMPVMIATIGLRAGLVVIGVGVTLVVLVAIPGLVHVDKTALAPEGLELLQGVPMLAVLPEHVIERLARTSTRMMVPAGESVFGQGDHGDLFYVIESGTARVSKAGRPVAELAAGDSFGEIALLRDVPRTAAVDAVTDLSVRADRSAPLPPCRHRTCRRVRTSRTGGGTIRRHMVIIDGRAGGAPSTGPADRLLVFFHGFMTSPRSYRQLLEGLAAMSRRRRSGSIPPRARRADAGVHGGVIRSTTTAAWSLAQTCSPSTNTGSVPTRRAEMGFPVGFGRGHETNT